MKRDSIIAAHPPSDGREWDCCCARCGGGCEFIDCWQCQGEGCFDEYDEDPINCSPGDFYDCVECNGNGGWPGCANSYEWCEAHPLEGRTDVRRPALEWYVMRSTEGA